MATLVTLAMLTILGGENRTMMMREETTTHIHTLSLPLFLGLPFTGAGAIKAVKMAKAVKVVSSLCLIIIGPRKPST